MQQKRRWAILGKVMVITHGELAQSFYETVGMFVAERGGMSFLGLGVDIGEFRNKLRIELLESKEKEFLKKASKFLKMIAIITGVILTIIYLINGGMYSLLFDLRESKTVIIYSVVIIVLLVLLILLNVKDEPAEMSKKKKDLNSYITVGTIFLIIFFAFLLIINLIDFFLPIIVLAIILIVAYFLVYKLIKTLIDKYGIK